MSNLAEITRGLEAGHGFVADSPVERNASSEVYGPRFIVEGDGFFVEWQMEDATPSSKGELRRL